MGTPPPRALSRGESCRFDRSGFVNIGCPHVLNFPVVFGSSP